MPDRRNFKLGPIDPGYPEPDANSGLVHAELSQAPRHLKLSDWRLIPIEVADIVPQENIHWLTQREFRDWKKDLIDAFKKAPETVSPIMVLKIPGRPGKYVILDGHHRWRSMKLAGRDAIWVMEVRGRLREPLRFEKQQVEK